ncbi:MAG TPA: hypothetical protein VFK89_00860 [Actinomycetota bacterium]|nr:hypothetical protein [Actinomycetota bacterium]
MRSVRALAALGLVSVLLAGCYGPDPDVTDAGGKPELTLDFPDPAPAGTVQELTITVSNPGPEDMDSVVVAFSRLGDPRLPPPLIDVAAKREPGAITDITPSPNGTSPDRVVFTFDGIREGDSRTITFRVEMPADAGFYGNAILVYEGSHPGRAKGVRLETHVRRTG